MNTHQALDYGNGEAYIIEDTNALYMSLEAPNNATTGDIIPVSDTTTTHDIKNHLRDMMWRFNADEEFNALYSPEFMQHNHFTPTQFLVMLIEDQAYFEHAGDTLNNAHTIAELLA